MTWTDRRPLLQQVEQLQKSRVLMYAMNFAVAGLTRIAQEIGDRLKEERKARFAERPL
jgi:hypothetical protein